MVRRRGRGRQGSAGPGTRAGPPCGRRPRSGSGSPRPPSPGCPRRTPTDRGRLLVDALIVWITPDRALQPGIRLRGPALGELHDHGRAPGEHLDGGRRGALPGPASPASPRSREGASAAVRDGGPRCRPRHLPPAPAAAAAGRESDDVALGRGPPRRRDRRGLLLYGRDAGRSEVSNLGSPTTRPTSTGCSSAGGRRTRRAARGTSGGRGRLEGRRSLRPRGGESDDDEVDVLLARGGRREPGGGTPPRRGPPSARNTRRPERFPLER